MSAARVSQLMEEYIAKEQAKLEKYKAKEREKLVQFKIKQEAKERAKQEKKKAEPTDKKAEPPTEKAEPTDKKVKKAKKAKPIDREVTIQSIRHLFTVKSTRVVLPKYYLAILKRLEGRKKPKVINSIHAVRRRYDRSDSR